MDKSNIMKTILSGILALSSLLCYSRDADKDSAAIIEFKEYIFAVVQIQVGVIKYGADTAGKGRVIVSIAGTAFYINDSTIMTADHVVKGLLIKPKEGFDSVTTWLFKTGSKKMIKINPEDFIRFPSIDGATLTISEKVDLPYTLSGKNSNPGDLVKSYGFVGGTNPAFSPEYLNNKFRIIDYDVEMVRTDRVGVISEMRSQYIMNGQIELNNKIFFRLSCDGNRGMSGGPSVSKNRIIGMNCFGETTSEDFVVKRLCVVSIEELKEEMNKK